MMGIDFGHALSRSLLDYWSRIEMNSCWITAGPIGRTGQARIREAKASGTHAACGWRIELESEPGLGT